MTIKNLFSSLKKSLWDRVGLCQLLKTVLKNVPNRNVLCSQSPSPQKKAMEFNSPSIPPFLYNFFHGNSDRRTNIKNKNLECIIVNSIPSHCGILRELVMHFCLFFTSKRIVVCSLIRLHKVWMHNNFFDIPYQHIHAPPLTPPTSHTEEFGLYCASSYSHRRYELDGKQ